MAAAAIPAVMAVVSAVLPLIPTAITTVESLFGAGNGAAKKTTVVDMLMKALQGLANTGKIPSAGVVDPGTPAAIANAVQSVFDQISVNVPGIGTVPVQPKSEAPAAPAASPVPAPTTIQIVKLGPNSGILITS